MHKLVSLIKKKIYDNIVKPALMSVAPIKEVALAMGLGLFIGLTPTAGIQMWMTFVIWLFFKYILGIRFDLIVATACVWISNPLTVIFIYYAFLVTGIMVFSILGLETVDLSFQVFQTQFSSIVANPDNDLLQAVVEGSKFLLVDLGLPMLVGSLVYAIPVSIAAYFLTFRFLLRYRNRKARKAGMDYESWRLKHERIRPDKKTKEYN